MRAIAAFFGLFLCCLQVIAQKPANRLPAADNPTGSQFPGGLILAKENFGNLKNRPIEDTGYIDAASRLGAAYYSMLLFDSALLCATKACQGGRKRYGENSTRYAYLLLDVATLQMESGQYQESALGFQQATAILGRKDSAFDKAAYIRCLTQYAGFYITIGSLKKAEELCLTAYEMVRKEPLDKRSYLNVLEKMTWLYEKLGFYARLETTQREAFEIQRQLYGENNPAYGRALGGQASLYERKGDLAKADSLYTKSLAIRERAYGKGCAANVAILNHLGIIKMERGKYDLAENYLKEAMDIVCREMNGEESALYPYCVKNLARLYVLSGKKTSGEILYQKCLAVYDRMGLTFSTGRLNVLHEMAELLYADNPPKAAIYLRKGVETGNIQLLNKLDFLSETELLAYLKSVRELDESPYRFLKQHKNAEIAGLAYNSRLIASGIGLQNTRTLYQNMAQSKDSVLAGCWKKYLQEKTFYINLLLTPVLQRKTKVDSVAADLNQQEKDLLRRSADYRNIKEKLLITWQDIRKRLEPGETAVEFVRFNAAYNALAYEKNIPARTESSTVYYAALVLRSQDSSPQFVMLCRERELIDVIKRFPYKATTNSRGGKPAETPPEKLPDGTRAAANGLLELLWRPLEPYLTHTRTLYYAPDGLLHRVAFGAIALKKDQLLCDRYNLVQVLSTRQIALQDIRAAAPLSIAMFGGIDYNRQAADSGCRSTDFGKRSLTRGGALDSFQFLPHTLREVYSIKAAAEAVRKQYVVFTGDHATETAFRNLEGENSPEVIHFATHGFTLSDNSAEAGKGGASFRSSYNPLMHCGLVMAGGNKGWQGLAGGNEDDGILTGLEISSVQLPNTQLAVLSACETGLGELEGSEGVFGLQRAFKLAGVNYVMASLWQVPDKETAEFMKIFYARWLGGDTIRQAFLHTQHLMRKKYPPYYWAGFTLVQ